MARSLCLLTYAQCLRLILASLHLNFDFRVKLLLETLSKQRRQPKHFHVFDLSQDIRSCGDSRLDMFVPDFT